MPSLRHLFLAQVVPRLRKAGEIDDEKVERARIEKWHAGLDRSLPTLAVPGFARRFSVVTEDLGFAAHVITPRHLEPTSTIYYVHGGGFTAPIDTFHLRYVTRLAARLGARVVLPDYPLTPEHTWRESHDALVEHASRWADEPGGIVLAGDSAGGNIALSMALAMRERGATPATHLVLHAPWVDLTTSTPETFEVAKVDPWLKVTKLAAYAKWWGGSDDLARPELSPGLGNLNGLPPALLLYGTRDLLSPGCRLLVERAAATDWQLTAIEEPDLIHVYGLLPGIPEAGRAFRQVLAFLR